MIVNMTGFYVLDLTSNSNSGKDSRTSSGKNAAFLMEPPVLIDLLGGILPV